MGELMQSGERKLELSGHLYYYYTSPDRHRRWALTALYIRFYQLQEY
jgi:hypothetical protein